MQPRACNPFSVTNDKTKKNRINRLYGFLKINCIYSFLEFTKVALVDHTKFQFAPGANTAPQNAGLRMTPPNHKI
jgi:hypothetical protein